MAHVAFASGEIQKSPKNNFPTPESTLHKASRAFAFEAQKQASNVNSLDSLPHRVDCNGNSIFTGLDLTGKAREYGLEI